MGRRQVVESVNSALKGAFVDLARGFFRVFGGVKMTVLLGFTVAAFNLDRIRSFRAKQSTDEPRSSTTPGPPDPDGRSAAQESGPTWWTRDRSRHLADRNE